jgi:hypothetical protein
MELPELFIIDDVKPRFFSNKESGALGFYGKIYRWNSEPFVWIKAKGSGLKTRFNTSWICIDLSNSNSLGKIYCWVFKTRKEARQQKQLHIKNDWATLSAPIKVYCLPGRIE